jgi:hypothetical protein
MSRIGLLLSVVAILAACTAGTVDASGNLVAEARPVEGFTRIEATTGVSVRLIVDPSNDAAVVVHYDDNLVDDVTTVVSGDTLRVGIDGSVSIPGDGERFVAVTVPSLTGVDVSNGANLVGTGSGPALEVTASTGANVDLHGFLAGAVILDASGGANVTITATSSVAGEASGGANVRILGDPTVNVETSGGANLSQG